MGRPTRNVVLVSLAVVVGLVLITVFAWRDDADLSTTGRVVEIDNRRICLSAGDSRECARVDRPPLVAGVRAGDCVEMRRSSDGILVEVGPAVECRD
jgi:hypothetical protein